jgi:hypothetical protein
MDGRDRITLLGAGVLCAVGIALTDTAGDRFLAAIVVLTLAAAVVAANHAVARRPQLTVEYRDTATSGPARVAEARRVAHSPIGTGGVVKHRQRCRRSD